MLSEKIYFKQEIQQEIRRPVFQDSYQSIAVLYSSIKRQTPVLSLG